VLVQKGLDLALGQGAHEAVHRLAADQQHAGRDAADAEGRGQLLFLVGIDLDQLEAAAVIGLDFFEDGTDHLAGAAPGAQKSTSTGVCMEASMTSASKLATVTLIMAGALGMAAEGARNVKSALYRRRTAASSGLPRTAPAGRAHEPSP
jgi:hypothetical protein